MSFVFVLQVTGSEDPQTRGLWRKGRGTPEDPGFPQTDERGGDDGTRTGAPGTRSPAPATVTSAPTLLPAAREGVLPTLPRPTHTRLTAAHVGKGGAVECKDTDASCRRDGHVTKSNQSQRRG